jgi:hypothetical protein
MRWSFHARDNGEREGRSLRGSRLGDLSSRASKISLRRRVSNAASGGLGDGSVLGDSRGARAVRSRSKAFDSLALLRRIPFTVANVVGVKCGRFSTGPGLGSRAIGIGWRVEYWAELRGGVVVLIGKSILYARSSTSDPRVSIQSLLRLAAPREDSDELLAGLLACACSITL